MKKNLLLIIFLLAFHASYSQGIPLPPPPGVPVADTLLFFMGMIIAVGFVSLSKKKK